MVKAKARKVESQSPNHQAVAKAKVIAQRAVASSTPQMIAQLDRIRKTAQMLTMKRLKVQMRAKPTTVKARDAKARAKVRKVDAKDLAQAKAAVHGAGVHDAKAKVKAKASDSAKVEKARHAIGALHLSTESLVTAEKPSTKVMKVLTRPLLLLTLRTAQRQRLPARHPLQPRRLSLTLFGRSLTFHRSRSPKSRAGLSSTNPLTSRPRRS